MKCKYFKTHAGSRGVEFCQCNGELLIYKPIERGDSYGIQCLCPNCDFPSNDTLTMDMKYCWNCGVKLDWSEWEEKK